MNPYRDRMIERLRAGDTPAQVAAHYDVARAYVLRLARSQGITPRSDATTRISLTSTRSAHRAHGGRHGEGGAVAPGRVQTEKEDKAAYLRARKANKAHAKVARFEAQQMGKSPEERRLVWLKKRHHLYRLGKKYGAHLK